MSYQYELTQQQQLMAMGRFNPMNIMMAAHNMQMMPLPREETPQEVDEESEEEDNEEKRTLFCANLDERVTEELLYEVFLQAGPIEKARIPKDPNGRQRTFGFITYVHRCSPPYAMQLFQGLSLFRKSLTIKFQGNTNPSPMRNNSQSSGFNKRSSYDNSSLRGGNYNDSPPQNPFIRSSDGPSGSGNRHDNISKHASSQSRPHSNALPYKRHSGGSEDRHRERDRDRDNDKRRHHHNDSNRRSDQRSGGGNFRR